MPADWVKFILNALCNTHFAAQAGNTEPNTANKKVEKTV